MTEEELYEKIATERLTPEKQIYTRASLMGRDADFSMFRYVIPANRVMRDDRPTGTMNLSRSSRTTRFRTPRKTFTCCSGS